MPVRKSKDSQIEDASYRLRMALDPSAMNVPRGVRPQTVSSNGSIGVSTDVDPARGLLGAYAVFGCEGEALTRPLWGEVDRMLAAPDRGRVRVSSMLVGADPAEPVDPEDVLPAPTGDEPQTLGETLPDVPMADYNPAAEAKKPRISLVNRVGVSIVG